LHTWWNLFPIYKLVERFNLVCVNTLGSVHGSCGPLTINPKTEQPFANDFPNFTVEDSNNFILQVLKSLDIESVEVAIGGSMGGMQILDLYLRFPSFAKCYISACGAPFSKMVHLYNAAQCHILEQAIEDGQSGISLKKQMDMVRFFFRLSCTSETALSLLQQRLRNNSIEFLERYFITDCVLKGDNFNVYSYIRLLRMLNAFQVDNQLQDLTPQHENTTLHLIQMKDDFLCPENEMIKLHELLISNQLHSQLHQFDTEHGHEAWITDGGKYYALLESIINTISVAA